MKRLALVLVACSGRGDPPADPPPAPATRAPIDARSAEADVLARALDADGHVPAALRRTPVAIDPTAPTDAALRRALAGAWLLRLGDELIAFDFDGDRARRWDGAQERSYRLRVEPCRLWLETDVGGVGYDLGLRRGIAVFGLGVVGRLERGVPIVCNGATGGRLLRKDAAGTTFTFRDPAFGDELVLHAADDLLWDDQLEKSHAEPVVDYATAAAIVSAQPAAIAIRAGGRIGDTTTVAGLVATAATDRAATIGRSVDVSGSVLDAASTEMNGEQTYYVDLHTPKDFFHPSVACFTKSSPLGAVHPDQVVRVRGRVESLDADGDVTLRPCALLP